MKRKRRINGRTSIRKCCQIGCYAINNILNYRHFIGCEISKEYCDIAVKRIEDAGGNVIQQRIYGH